MALVTEQLLVRGIRTCVSTIHRRLILNLFFAGYEFSAFSYGIAAAIRHGLCLVALTANAGKPRGMHRVAAETYHIFCSCAWTGPFYPDGHPD